MRNITFQNASAGSGKTWTQTEILANLLIEGKAEPEQIIMTTFTEASSQDIKEKAKAKLYQKAHESGDVTIENMAQRLDQAMINTIDGVCNAFINRYWYALGLSPKMSVITEADKRFYFNQSISDVVTDDDLAFLEKFSRLFAVKDKEDNGNTWQKHLAGIVDTMTSYNITSLNNSKDYSLRLAHRFVEKGLKIQLPTRKELQDVMDVLSHMELAASNAATRQKLAGTVDENYVYVKSLLDLCGKNKTISAATQHFINKYERIFESEEVYGLQKEYINRLFDIADRWKSKYEEFKQQHHILDFVEMERYMFQMLTEPKYQSIKEEIAANYKYVFVDEFQDCSPLQVRLFDILSDLLPNDGHSYWVGDRKQSIYGWRGADPVLTDAVIQAIDKRPSCNIAKPLSTSWRSVPALVDATNRIFTPVFSEMSPDEVQLTPSDKCKERGKTIKDSLRYWALRGGNDDDRMAEIVNYVLELKQSGEVDPGDIAILGRTKDFLSKLAACFEQSGVSVDYKTETLKDNVVCKIFVAILNVMAHPYHNLAKTEIAYLTQEDKTIANIIDEKLEWNSKAKEERGEFLEDVPLITEIVALRPRLQHLSVSSLIETMVVELNLNSVAALIPEARQIDTTIQALVKAATVYEERCLSLGLPATIDGYIAYLQSAEVSVNGDSDSIHLLTYHKSKGLQWRYVILTQLNHDPNASSNWYLKNYSGVHAEHIVMPTDDDLYPEMLIRLQPWLFGEGKSLPQSLKDKCDANHITRIELENMREAKRTLYVGMTRAEDVMILAVQEKAPNKDGKNGGPQTKWLDSVKASISNITFMKQNVPSVTTNVPAQTTSGRIVNIKGKECKAAKRDIMPSSAHEMGKVERVVYWNKRLSFPNLEDNLIGDCIHTIFCGMDYNNDHAHIKEILSSFAIEPNEELVSGIVAAWEQLTQFLTDTYGAAKNKYHELAFKHKTDNGQIVTGSMDFVWETAQGVVLIDYKTCQMGVTDIEDAENKKGHYSGMYKGQFDCYATALKKHGKSILDRLVFYPSIGLVERIL